MDYEHKVKIKNKIIKIKDKDIAKALELPPIKLHCSVLAEASIKKAIEDWENKKSVQAALFQPVS